VIYIYSNTGLKPFFIDDPSLLKYDRQYYMKTAEPARMDIAQLHRIEYEAPPDVIVSAPGILRLIGEHTADADGCFLALPFSHRLYIALSPRRDSSIRFFAADLNERKRTNISNLKYKREDRWSNYVKGALAIRAAEGSLSRGYNITIWGDIPMDLGLGSATALTCVAVRAIAIALGVDHDDDALEKDVIAVDRLYFERQSRVSDYQATIRSSEAALVHVDAGTAQTESLPLPFGSARVLLTDSRVPRPPVDTELATRTADCAKGLSILGGASRGLRAYDVNDLEEYMGIMPEHVRRHCSFFLDEILRVREAREAAQHGDLQSFSKALNRSQTGLRNHYEISCPEVDWLVKRSLEIDGVHASRLTGKGFGGCIITILENDSVNEYRQRLDEYERIFGFKPVVWDIEPGAGMMVH
jgi:galactokinase